MSTFMGEKTEGEGMVSPRVMLVGPRLPTLVQFFHDRGFETLCVDDPLEARLVAGVQKPDLIIFEVEADPKSDSADITSSLLELTDRPAVLAAGTPKQSTALLLASQAGCHGLVVCPPSESVLFDIVARTLQERRTQKLLKDAESRLLSAENATVEALQKASSLAEKNTRLKGLEKEQNESKAKAKDSHKELKKLRSALEKSRDALEDSNAIEKSLRAELEALADSLRNMNRAQQTLRAENEALHLQNNTLETRAVVDDEGDLAALQKDHQTQLSALKNEAQRREKEALRFEAKLAVVEAERDELKEVLDSTKAEHEQALNNATQSSTSANDLLEKKLASLTADLQASKENALALDKEVKALQKSEAQNELSFQSVMQAHQQDERELRALLESERQSKKEAQDALKNANPSDELKALNQSLENQALDFEIENDKLRDELKTLRATLDTQRDEAKRERLRLIEEKQDAANGSVKAFQKMEALVLEVRELRKKTESP